MAAQPGGTESDGGSGSGRNRENQGDQSRMESETFPHQEMVEPNSATPRTLSVDESKQGRKARNNQEEIQFSLGHKVKWAQPTSSNNS